MNTTAAAGHEIGNHTVSHKDLLTLTSKNLNLEITQAKKTIETKVTSQKVLSFAYPLGSGAGETAKDFEVRDTIKASGHIAARSTNPYLGNYSYNFATTDDDYYKIRTFAMDGSVTRAAFAKESQNAINGGGLMVYLYHSLDNLISTYGDSWYAKVLQDSLQKQLDTLGSLQDKIWITTFIQAVKYHKEKNSATLSEIQAPNGSVWVLNLSDTLVDNSIYDQPLTLKLKMNGVAYDHIYQNGNILPYNVIGDTVIFNALPDGGNITLMVGEGSSNIAPTLDPINSIVINQNGGTQTINLTGITAGESESQNLNIQIFTLNSHLIQDIQVNYSNPSTSGTLTFVPNPNASGKTKIVVRVSDNATVSKFIERTFDVTVTSSTLSINNKILSEDFVKVLPNPFTDFLTINSEIVLSNASIDIYNLSGKIIYAENLNTLKSKQINLTGQQPGIYILKIKAEQGEIIKKIALK